MVAKYQKEHEVAYYECDINQTMTFPAMLGVAIKVSEEQSAVLERGPEYIRSFGLTWIITTYHITVNRLPMVGEQIMVSTQAKEYNKYFCYRYFWLHDAQGNELVKIESVFALMDLETRKVSSVPDEIVAPFESEKIKRIKRYPKINSPEKGHFLPYRVRFYDIDSNQHVNNAMYFNWLLDVLGYEFLTTHQVKEITIRFDREVEYGNLVESHFETIRDENDLETLHEIRIGETTYCEAAMKWHERTKNNENN
ncbi:acyl-ACP thioesterase domain-containing protein [Enterococcus gallinarum]|uniref:acyl-ACP thioesterase domain-containing protein n=1 Tax=Enterococcus gallinarum TaxID=1353 RepID=UPI0022E8CE93|nr:acyl-ACP thioesterase domain-containing protein [Enterococcus gallinarum]